MKNHYSNRLRQGVSATEVLVAASLLLGVIGMVANLGSRTKRMIRSTHQYQIATQELTNQLEILTSLPVDQVPKAISQIRLSAEALEYLPDAEIIANIVEDPDGRRVVMSIAMGRNQQAVPLEMVAWLNGPTKAEAETSLGSKDNKLDSLQITEVSL
ncbi:MAG: hypothetical protein ABL921_24435 [Pirellula sp.]